MDIECNLVGGPCDYDDVTGEVEEVPDGEQRPSLPQTNLNIKLVLIKLAHSLRTAK